MNILPDWLRTWYINLIQPAIKIMIKYRLNPNWFTTLGLIISAVSAYFFAIGSHRIAGAIYLLAGTFDIIDGKVARSSGRVTKFGAVYDSTLDRYAEMLVLFGLVFYYSHLQSFVVFNFDWSIVGAVAAAVTLGGSIMVSYIRARAESLGLDCKVGLMQRPERVVYLGFGAIFHEYALLVVLVIIAILSNATAIQRLVHVRKQALASSSAPNN
jgi:CDP-diacylglycerol--glycerol-3-phosphate 3-phosphatidyltransferase